MIEFEAPEDSESGNAEEDEIEPWWEYTSPSEARRQLRKLLQERHPLPTQLWMEWLRYLSIARSRGETRFAARIGYWLLRKWEREGIHLPDKFDEEGARMLPRTVGISIPFATEDPSVPLSHLAYLKEVFHFWSRETTVGHLDPNFLRLVSHRPLGEPARPEDIEALLELLPEIVASQSDTNEEKNDDDADDDDDEPSRSRVFCPAGQVQILIEALLDRGDANRAIEIAKEVVGCRPCFAICDLAPRGFLSRLLEPLVEQGDRETAAAWNDRLVGLLQGPVAGIAEAGYRAAYLSKIGETEQALELIEQVGKLLDRKDLTSWRKLEFHRGAIRALRVAGLDASEHESAARKIAEDFDRRNGNEGVSRAV